MSPRLIAGLASAVVALATLTGLYWKGRLEGAARERARTEAALVQARTSGLEARAERASAQRVEVVVRQREAAARTLVPFTQDAMTSEDAHAPLDPDRAARLRAHDHQLCLIADLAGCPADRDAAGSAEDMRDPPPAGAADAF
ncbi:hypothetical protein [Phenylobacterium sp.]|uniref:hypothetical protein n=1 Tax=Phenylobacterium sp. TaxID=1871053 RepID=UPI003919F468